MKKFISAYKIHLIVTLLLLVIAAGIPFDSYFSRELPASELEIHPEAEDIVTFTEDEDPILRIEPGSGYTGIVAETAHVTLKKGSYRLQVVSLSNGEQNYVEIRSPRKLNEDNTEGKLLVKEPLKQNGDITEIYFDTEDSMEDISVRIVYGGGGDFNVSGFYLTSVRPMYTDIPCLMGAILLCSVLILIWKMRGGRLDKEGKTALLLLSAAVILGSLPLSYNFVLDGHDLYYQFNRILGIQEGLKNGQFPVKIHSTLLHGYGYGSPIFYPQLFLYFPALLGCLGVSLVNCYKVLLIGMNVATAFVAYRSFSGLTRSRKIGLVAALLYTLSVYRLIDLYTRAAVGEAMAMIFFPLVLWGMYELFLGNPKKWYLAALGFSGVLQSHVLSVELTVCFGSIFGLCCLGRLREKKRWKALLFAAGSTLLLNLGVIFTLLHHAVYPYRVFCIDITLSWWTVTLPKLFDFILANPTMSTWAMIQNSEEMPCSLGFVMLAGILAFLYVYLREEKKDGLLKGCFGALGLSLLGIYLSTDLFPWDKVQGLPVIHRLVTSLQLPWRFLSLSTVLLCLVCAVGFYRFCSEKEVRKLVCGSACVLAFLCAGIYINRYSEEAMPKYTKENQYQREQSQVDVLYFINVPHSNSYRIWHRANTFAAPEGIALSECKRAENLTAEFRYELPETGIKGEEAWVDVPFTYYPNYAAYAEDGTRLKTGIGDQGTVRVWIAEDTQGLVKVRYQEPWFYHAGRIISIIFLILLTAGIFRKRKKLQHS